jgi:4a-hydroxytetrahydrobiopterin dehydratase
MSSAAGKKAVPVETQINIKNMTTLTSKEINLRMKRRPDWSKRAKTIFRTFKFEDFLHSLDFVKLVAKKAQKLNHHPDIDIRYDKVKLTLTTHDAGGLSEKDFTLAEQCDVIFATFSEA